MTVGFRYVRVERAPQSGEPPLVVDLDETLVRTDLLWEMALAHLRGNPLRVLQLLHWASKGRAQLKRRLAEAVDFDCSLLPVNEAVVELARQAQAAGQRVYLATAGDILVAEKMAPHFDFLDGVVGSDGEANLKGRAKAELLAREFDQGFDYAGDSRADMHVWRHARRVILVEARQRLVRDAERLGKPTVVLPRPSSQWRALLKGLRMHQWAKNALVFIPALLSAQISVPHQLLMSFLAFLALGLVASGSYLFNDLWDLQSDRQHWSKRNRPLASGRLSIKTGVVASIACIAAGFLLCTAVNAASVFVLACYLVLTLAYSFRLKRVPLLDAFTLAVLFTLRLALGITAVMVPASPWLLVFSMFLFTSLSYAKRHTEIARVIARGGTTLAGRGYVAADAPLLLILGLASGTASVLILVLYLINDAFGHAFYGNTQWLWILPGCLFLWVSRVWLLCNRGELHDDPVAFAVRDRVSLVLGGLMALGFALAWIGVGA